MKINKAVLIENPQITIEVKAKSDIEELENIWYLINNIDFFDKNNYYPVFPNHDFIEQLLQKKRNKENIEEYFNTFKELFQKELYSVSDYSKGIKNAKENLKRVERIFEKLENYVELWDFELFSNYIVSISLYGTSGAYYSTENEGIINLRAEKNGLFRRGIDPSATIVHEIIHIGIEKNIVRKYDLPHNVKERVVDKFLTFNFRDIFPEYELKERGDKSIDSFISSTDDWNNLPDRICEYKKIK